MLKKISVYWDNFFYKVLVKNLLKLSHLGYGTVVRGAESGVNFEHMYDNEPKGQLIIGRYIDKILLNLPAVHATRGRKEDVKKILWNQIQIHKKEGIKTKVLDLASGGARYLRELKDEHNQGLIESICIDRDESCVRLGRELSRKEKVKDIRFVTGDIFKLKHLKRLSEDKTWRANVVIASGFFIYFNEEVVKKVLEEIYEYLPVGGLLIFSSYERLNTKKLMRKTMSTSSGEQWTLYYRQPDYWHPLLMDIGYTDVFVTRDEWQMNNVCYARK